MIRILTKYPNKRNVIEFVSLDAMVPEDHLLRKIDSAILDTETIFVDSTHIKASANTKRKAKKAVPKQTKRYAKELMEEVNKDREEHGKKPFDEDDNETPEEREATISTTDPESGLFYKGEHKKCFAYEAHTAYDGHNFIMDVVVTAGNIHDSVAFDPL